MLFEPIETIESQKVERSLRTFDNILLGENNKIVTKFVVRMKHDASVRGPRKRQLQEERSPLSRFVGNSVSF